MPAKNGQPPFSGFDCGFVDPVELEEFAIPLSNFFLDVTLPKISSQAEGAVCLFVQGDVIWSFEPDHVIAFGFVFVVSPGFGVLEEGQTHFLAGEPQRFDVIDLCFDFSEVTHFVPLG
jgi:hypothetical protein